MIFAEGSPFHSLTGAHSDRRSAYKRAFHVLPILDLLTDRLSDQTTGFFFLPFAGAYAATFVF